MSEGMTRFAVAGPAGGFVPLETLGFAARTTADVARIAPELRAITADEAFWSTQAERAIWPDGLALRSPVTRPCDVICVGLNYRAHAEETALSSSESPLLFAKWSSSISAPNSDVHLDPEFTSQLDYEVELGVVIARKIERGQDTDLLGSVLGYTVANDISARDVQFAEGNWTRAKSAKGFLPVGPWISTPDALPDLSTLSLSCTVNGQLRQSAYTSQMIFSVEEILRFAARTMDLFPGDLILTGTPAGVALGMPEPQWLGVGDVVTCQVDGLGSLTNEVKSVKEIGATR